MNHRSKGSSFANEKRNFKPTLSDQTRRKQNSFESNEVIDPKRRQRARSNKR